MKRLISILAIAGFTALANAQPAPYVAQYQIVSKPVVGIVNANTGQAAGVSLPAATLITNSLVSSAALGAGQAPPGLGLSWNIYGSSLVSGAPLYYILNSTVTGTGTNQGYSVKQIQGLPYEGGIWQNIMVVSNALPTATNTVSTNLYLVTTNFYGYVRARVYTITNTSALSAPTTNNVTETDQILVYH